MSDRILYLHGFASGPTSSKARFFQSRLRDEGIDMAVPDLAEGDFEHLTITGQLRVVEKLAGGEPVTLIGSSMGGYVAALYAARHPEVRKLLLLAPAFGLAHRWLGALPPNQAAEWKQTGYLTVYHYADRADRRVWYRLIEDGLNYEELPDVRRPVLVFHGRQDTVVPAELSEKFVDRRPHARLRLVDDGHELISALDLIWAESRDFLLTE